MRLWHDAHTDCYIAKTDAGDVLGVFTTRAAAAKAIARHLNGEPPCVGCGPVAKGERAGHPFRGNQHTGGRPGSGPGSVRLKGKRRGPRAVVDGQRRNQGAAHLWQINDYQKNKYRVGHNKTYRPVGMVEDLGGYKWQGTHQDGANGKTTVLPGTFGSPQEAANAVQEFHNKPKRGTRVKAALARAAQALQHPTVVRASGYASGAVAVARQFAHVEGTKPKVGATKVTRWQESGGPRPQTRSRTHTLIGRVVGGKVGYLGSIVEEQREDYLGGYNRDSETRYFPHDAAGKRIGNKYGYASFKEAQNAIPEARDSDSGQPFKAVSGAKPKKSPSFTSEAFDLKESDAASMASALGVKSPKKRRTKAERKARLKALAAKYGFGPDSVGSPSGKGGDPTALAGWLVAEGVRKGEREGHPFRGNQYTGGISGGTGRRKPAKDLSPSMLKRRTNGMAKRLGMLLAAGLDTEGMYSFVDNEGERRYTPDRERLHQEIVTELMERGRATAKKEGRALFMGGLPGSGKSTMVESEVAKASGIDKADFITVNPDDIKDIMVQKGMLPDTYHDPRFKSVKSLKPMELVALIHEESSKIAFDLAEKVQNEGYNIIWDITMSGDKQVQKRLDPLVDGVGPKYSEIIMMFQDVSPETSKRRANARYVGMDTADPEKGGRFVPGFVIDGSVPNDWSEYHSTNREAFEISKRHATRWELWNNDVDGVPARRMAIGGPNAPASQVFLQGVKR